MSMGAADLKSSVSALFALLILDLGQKGVRT